MLPSDVLCGSTTSRGPITPLRLMKDRSSPTDTMEPKGRSTEGLAPFASVEDLSDEQDSPGEKHRLTLPGVKEESGTKSPRMGVPTPRIDISRASSSSHQDDSSPERDLFTDAVTMEPDHPVSSEANENLEQNFMPFNFDELERAIQSLHNRNTTKGMMGGTEGGPVAKLGLGFTEEMAQELRNSTEELDFQDPTDVETKQRRRKLHQQQALNKYELEMQGEKDGKERKDSACSDTGLLYISGRTSRLSSIGSAASGGSAASHASGVSHISAVSHLSGASHFSGVSHISGASHLSATSQLSRASRCSSPHKMLLETSFCGPKPIPTVSLDAEYPPKESVEATLLARKTDPTGAVLPVEEGKHLVNGKPNVTKRQHKDRSHSTKSSSSTLTVGREPSIKSKSSERSAKPQNGTTSRSSSFHSKTSRSGEDNSNVDICTPVKADSEKTTPSHRKEPPRLPPGSDAKFISLHDDEEKPIPISKSKSINVPLSSDSRISSVSGEERLPPNNELKRNVPLDEGSRIISLHSDEPTPPLKVPVSNTSKRKPMSKENAPKTLPVCKTDSKSVPSVSRSKRKQPIKYEGDQIFIPLTGDETPIVLSGGSGKTPTKPPLDANSRIIPLHGSPEEPTEEPNQKINQDSKPLDKDSRIIPLKGDEIEIHTTSRRVIDSSQQQQRRKKPTLHPDASAVIIPLHGDEEIVALEIETDRPSSPEYGIYIPLKGPEIADYSRKAQLEMKSKTKPETIHKPSKLDVKPKSKSSKISPSTESKPVKKKRQEEELVQFISLHADESERKPLKIEITEEISDDRYNLKATEFRSNSVSPVCQAEIQSIQHTYFKPDESSAYSRKHSTSSCRSPEFEGVKVKPATLDLTQIVRPSRPVQSLTQLTRDESRTPSPATSMSRGSLFRRSSESSSSTKSRVSVSSEFKSRKDSKNKSVFTSLFKKGSRDSIRRKSESSEKTTPLDPRVTKVEFTFNQQDRGKEEDVIIIPLHSPDSKQPPTEGQREILIHPPDLTAETVQTISEVVAAIEELKSQPLVSPVPTLPHFNKKDKATSETETVKTVLKIGLPKQITEEDSQIEDVKLVESEKIKIVKTTRSKNELEIQHLSIETDVSPKSETSGGSIKTQLEASLEKQDSDKKSDSETVKTGSEERKSSESELDSDAMLIPKDQLGKDKYERKDFFLQQESVEEDLPYEQEDLPYEQEDLPYVPTTLPLERPVAHPIVPIKERVTEMKTFSIDRPRSTTPINPTSLDDYVSSPLEDTTVSPREKMQIVLPRTESLRESRSKSPHQATAKQWTHFAEQGLQSPRELRRVASSSPPPPLPPRSTAPWVCFDEVPERRRTPKRITTLPPSQPQTSGVVYSYVNPEECSCECHETQSRVNGAQCSDSGARCQYKDPYRT